MSRAVSIVESSGKWQHVLSHATNSPVACAILEYLPKARWYRDKARRKTSATVTSAVSLTKVAALLFVRVEFSSGEPSTYLLPVAYEAQLSLPGTAILELRGAGERGFLIDASGRPEVPEVLFRAILAGERLGESSAEVIGYPEPALSAFRLVAPQEGRLLNVEQTNTSYVVGGKCVLKLQRKLEPGVGQELEVLKHLAQTTFTRHPRLLGHLELHGGDGIVSGLGILQEFVPSQGDAFRMAVEAAGHFYQHAAAIERWSPPCTSFFPLRDVDPPREVAEPLGPFVPSLQLLGQRSAEMHIALSCSAEPGLGAENFTGATKAELRDSIEKLATRAFEGLRACQTLLNERDRRLSESVLRVEPAHFARTLDFPDSALLGARIRVHGDFHLGQVLVADGDFFILDFEGEPGRSPDDRRTKRSPLADVAGMLRSFHYAAHAARTEQEDLVGSQMRSKRLMALAEAWHLWAGARFLRGYFRSMLPGGLLPAEEHEIQRLLSLYVLEKALYEVAYESENRPAWVGIPLLQLSSLVECVRQ